MKKLLTLLLSLTIAFSLAGCFGGDDAADVDMEDGEEMEEMMDEEMEDAVASEMMEYKVFMNFLTGFEDDYVNYDMTLNQIVDGWTYPETSPAAGFSPAAGMKHILFNLDVNNPEDNEGNASPLMNDWTLAFGNDTYKPVFFLAESGREGFPNMLDVAAGESANHDLLFEVPSDLDVHGGILRFEAVTPSNWTPEVKLGELIDLKQFN